MDINFISSVYHGFYVLEVCVPFISSPGSKFYSYILVFYFTFKSCFYSFLYTYQTGMSARFAFIFVCFLDVFVEVQTV